MKLKSPDENYYTVTFDKTDAGATGTMSDQTIASGSSANLTACGFSKTGWTFAGWATIPTGSVIYADGASYTMGSANVTFYAKWTANGYTITFNKNDAGATGTMLDQTIASGSSANLTACGFSKTGWTFAGWATIPTGNVIYADGASYTMGSANVTLYAKWTDHTYKVTYNGNGNTGGAVPAGPTNYYEGEEVTVLGNTGNFVKTGDSFACWNTAANGSGADYTQGQTFPMGTADVTLYAEWTADYVIGDTGPAGGFIFYDKGFYSDGWRYLEAAPSDQSTSEDWRGEGTLIGTTSTDIGTGASNTTAIVTALGAGLYAAAICDDLLYGGEVDWFLPSKDELNLMYTELHLHGVGGFGDWYWTSSEHDADLARWQNFDNGYFGITNKSHDFIRVRAVRVF